MTLSVIDLLAISSAAAPAAGAHTAEPVTPGAFEQALVTAEGQAPAQGAETVGALALPATANAQTAAPASLGAKAAVTQLVSTGLRGLTPLPLVARKEDEQQDANNPLAGTAETLAQPVTPAVAVIETAVAPEALTKDTDIPAEALAAFLDEEEQQALPQNLELAGLNEEEANDVRFISPSSPQPADAIAATVPASAQTPPAPLEVILQETLASGDANVQVDTYTLASGVPSEKPLPLGVQALQKKVQDTQQSSDAVSPAIVALLASTTLTPAKVEHASATGLNISAVASTKDTPVNGQLLAEAITSKTPTQQPHLPQQAGPGNEGANHGATPDKQSLASQIQQGTLDAGQVKQNGLPDNTQVVQNQKAFNAILNAFTQSTAEAHRQNPPGDDALPTSIPQTDALAALNNTNSLPVQKTDGQPDVPYFRNAPQFVPVPEQLAVRLRAEAKDGNTHFNLKLQPAELGRVDVRMEVSPDGKAGLIITAENKDALDMLQRDARSLERALQDAGLKTDSGSLSFHLRGEQQQGRGAFESNYKGNSYGSAEDEEDISTLDPAGGYVTRVNLMQGLDIHV